MNKRNSSPPSPPLVVHAVGARPNFVKMAPVIRALEKAPGIRQVVVHTGQHYDRNLSDDIVADLGLPEPKLNLGIGSGTHAEQTGRTMIAFERVLLDLRPSLVVVAGDVNATLACSLAAAKLGVPIAHVESGLRSHDWTMPEEINRTITDRLSRFLFIHSPEAREHLLEEGCGEERIHYVGNTMIDSLRRLEPRARERRAWEKIGVAPNGYILITLHRPSNVDEPTRLAAIVDELVRLSERAPVVFPVHPRTRSKLDVDGELARLEQAGARVLEPLGYLDFLSLETEASAIVTDSGGVQEEASALGIPCFTLRPNTERPITISQGTNTLLGDDPAELRRVDFARRPLPAIPLWDGHAGERIAAVLEQALSGEKETPDGA
ncbi:MAG: non-hydrolyzing UDP-N-acetylglucosamine 2-epimerase [Gaiellaceae bacterium]